MYCKNVETLKSINACFKATGGDTRDEEHKVAMCLLNDLSGLELDGIRCLGTVLQLEPDSASCTTDANQISCWY